MSKNFIVNFSSIPVPIVITNYSPTYVGIATKAIAITLSKSGYIRTDKLIAELSEWSGMEEDKIAEILSICFDLKPSHLVNEVIIPRPILKVQQQKPKSFEKKPTIDDPDFLEACTKNFPKQNITEELKTFISYMRSKNYLITQQGFLNHLHRKQSEENILSSPTIAKPVNSCATCNDTRIVHEFLLGEIKALPCPTCVSFSE